MFCAEGSNVIRGIKTTVPANFASLLIILHLNTCALASSKISHVPLQSPIDTSRLCRSIRGQLGLSASLERESPLQQLAEQEAQRQIAAAVAAEPLYHDPLRHIDIEAALQEHNGHEQEWIQRMHQMWRNE
jgi:hypothetical protein